MNHAITRTLLVCSFILYSVSLFAQHYSGAEAKGIYNGATQLTVNEQRHTISFIRLDPSFTIAMSAGKDWLHNDVLKLRQDDDLVQYQEKTDNVAFTHYRYKQYYKGVPVVDGVYYIHNKNGKVISANGEWYDGINLDVQPSLTAGQAYNKALAYYSAQTYMHNREDADNNQLMILPDKESYKLVYRSDVYALQPYKRSYIYVDAKTGDVVKEESRIHNTSVYGTAVTQYSGIQTIAVDSVSENQYRLREDIRGAGVETYDFSNGSADYYDTDNYWVNYNILDIVAYDAHFGAEATFDFYDQTFGWQSVDGNGQQKLLSYVHNNGSGAINAFWDGNAMNYGDGDPENGIGALTSLDVCGHELTHGVTENSSGLNYSGESGALNESYSDIAGINLRFLHVPNATWLIDDQENFPFRDMSNPKAFNCPDTYGGTFWNYGDVVHYNSGVQNYWFYLLTEGKSSVNDVGDVYEVEGIGLTDAVQIALRTDMVYLTSNSTFNDAREFSIQSAIDYFGDCSNQVVQTANAWYAVNVGELYTNTVNAVFGAPQTSFCSTPATVDFSNTSNNGSSYSWDFGDGNSSALEDPSHTYTTSGTYTVTLTVNGTSGCNTSDTAIYTDYIYVGSTGAPLPASCAPSTISNPQSYGIYRFILNTIDHISPNNDGYQDYSCQYTTTLVAGSKYLVQAYTNGDLFFINPAENFHMWIDYNNDGEFDNVTELVLSKDNDTTIISDYIEIPETAVQNVPLRVRIMDDKKQNAITGPCYNPNSGQCEDYAIVIVPSSTAPIADFIGDPTTINVQQAVHFTDLSQNTPTSWQWTFDGGTPATSTDENPVITYNTPGNYTASLIATNAFGSDTLTIESYITVLPAFNICQIATVDYYEGGFFDTGGPFNKYAVNENCSLLISPECAGPIALQVSTFDSQSGTDVLSVYDGTDDTAPLLMAISGSPALPITLVAPSGKMFVKWVSDNATVKDGFYAAWASTQGGTVTPVTDFSASDYNPAYGTSVAFTDLSTNLPIYWSWDFGDGNFSNLENPSHAYGSPGSYEVKLISSNCGGSDTTKKTIVAQDAPVISVTPNPVNIDLNCASETGSATVTIQNTGGGDLLYSQSELEYNFQGDQPNILSLTYGANVNQEYANVFNAIDLYGPAYTLTSTGTQSGPELAAALEGKNTFIMTKPTGTPSVYTSYAAPLQNFVNNGGTVIFCATTSSKVDCIFNTGLLSGAYGAQANSVPIDVVNVNDPLVIGLPATIATAPKNTYSLNITNADFVKVIDYLGNPVAGYRSVGLGKVIYIGFDYKVDDDDTANLVMGNALNWVNTNLVPDWVTVTPSTGGTVEPSSSQTITISVNANGVADGTYTEYLSFASNDPNNPVDSVPVIIKVSTGSCVSFAAQAQCEGQVCFDDSISGGGTVSYDFGDGGISTENDPCHTYGSSGVYTVQMIGCGDFGCDTIEQTITVTILSASIQYSPTVVYENQLVSFTSNSDGAVSWSWDFGDGNTSTQENPVHAYITMGSYTVTLTATDANGCSVSSTQTITIISVGVDEVGADFDLNVYPNPFSSGTFLSYTLPVSTNVTVELWNELGQKISTLVSNENQVAGKHVYPINVNEAAVYTIRFSAGENVSWKKLVKIQ